ncbi:MAG: hypothetical protein ACK41Q_07685, partial [Candidatus Brocadia sp.]
QTFLRGLSTQKWYFQPLRYPILQGTPLSVGANSRWRPGTFAHICENACHLMFLHAAVGCRSPSGDGSYPPFPRQGRR